MIWWWDFAFVLPVVAAFYIESKDMDLEKHAVASIVIALLEAVLVGMPAFLILTLMGGTITVWGLTFSGVLTFMLFGAVLVISIINYWITVAITKGLEKVVEGL
ncbi:MAG: hypothetical protein ACE5KD_00585 [Candidatus Bathyarchaeia archaeon]